MNKEPRKAVMIFEEAEGITPFFFDATKGMLLEEGSASWLVIQSPINVSQANFEVEEVIPIPREESNKFVESIINKGD